MAGATSVTNSANSGVITAVFPITDATIRIAAIPGVTAPVTGETPVSEGTETDEYTVTSVTWTPDDVSFASDTAYTAMITLTPKTGYILAGVTANFFKVAGATSVINSADSGIVTAVFLSYQPDNDIEQAA